MTDQIEVQELALFEDQCYIKISGFLELSESAKGGIRLQLRVCSGEAERILPMRILYFFPQDGRIRFGAEGRFRMKYVFSGPAEPGEKVKIDFLEAASGVRMKAGIPNYSRVEDSRYRFEMSEGQWYLERCAGGRRQEQEYRRPPLAVRVCRGLLFVFALLFIPLWVLEGGFADRGYIPFAEQDISRYPSARSRILRNMNQRLISLTGHGISPTAVKTLLFRKIYRMEHRRKLRRAAKAGGKPELLFLSIRSAQLSGNMKCVYDACERENAWSCVPFPIGKEIKNMKLRQVYQTAKACGGADLILLDDRTSFIDEGRILPDTKVVQLWHACGAFKTFGFSRIGKDRTVKEEDPNHRRYDYAIVSSQSVRSCYAEGFGIPVSSVIAAGIPRTDWLLDPRKRAAAAGRVYDRYPQIMDKRVILFAPTFRGNGKIEAYYPMERFDVDSFANCLGAEDILLIKHHPFVRERHPIPEKWGGQVLDAGDYEEFNELLCVADLLITDYSSAVFEAALLGIPMLFYVFDLAEYTATRDFYYPYRDFVPGPMAETQKELEALFRAGDQRVDRVRAFAERFFDHPGTATAEVVRLIKKIVLK